MKPPVSRSQDIDPGPVNLRSHLHKSQVYAPAFFRAKRRVRVFAVLHRDRDGWYLVTTEHGEVFRMPGGSWGYAMFRRAVTTNKLTVFTELRDSPQCFPYVNEALEDEAHAKVCANSRGSITAVYLRMGNKHGEAVSYEAWYRSELGLSDFDFMRAVRITCDLIGHGDCATASQLGWQSLLAFWKSHHIPKVQRVPGHMQSWLDTYKIGGRVEWPASPEARYPRLWEADLKSAYPEAVSAGLPWGRPAWYPAGADPKRMRESGRVDFAVSYGMYAVHVTSDLHNGPVGRRNWKLERSAISYDMSAGETFEQALWDFEADSLQATGCVDMEWRGGYTWPELTTAFAGWVGEVVSLRYAAIDMHDAGLLDGYGEKVAKIVKLATNAAIGRFSMDRRVFRLVASPHGVEPLPGDRPIQLPRWVSGHGYSYDAGDYKTANLRRFADEERAPLNHWGRYIVARVANDMYRSARSEETFGNGVAALNFDAMYLVGPPSSACRDDRRWRFSELDDVSLPYRRAVVYTKSGGARVIVQKLPGIGASKRKARCRQS